MDLIEELVLPYDATAPTLTLDRRRRLLRGRLIALGFTVVVMTVIYLWQRAAFSTALYVIYGIVLAVSLAFVVFRLIGFLRARRVLAQLSPGIAVRIGRGGVQVGELGTSWSGVARLRAAPGGLGRPAEFQLQTTDGTVSSVPLDQIAVFPATLDSTARAYSGGRVGVDLSGLDT